MFYLILFDEFINVLISLLFVNIIVNKNIYVFDVMVIVMIWDLLNYCLNDFYFQIMRFDTSMESLINIGRSESYADLNNPDFGIARSFMNSSSSLFSGSG